MKLQPGQAFFLATEMRNLLQQDFPLRNNWAFARHDSPEFYQLPRHRLRCIVAIIRHLECYDRAAVSLRRIGG
jgi:hypothetical protein